MAGESEREMKGEKRARWGEKQNGGERDRGREMRQSVGERRD